jgi:hypothetical protein
MQDTFDVHGSADQGSTPLLDFERLDVYRVALEFQALASSIRLPAGRRELRDQLDRAALSTVLNTAEGAGRVGAADKKKVCFDRASADGVPSGGSTASVGAKLV